MKKFKTTLTLTLLAVLPVFAERHAVFLKTGGTGDGSSPESAVGTFDDAFAAMDDDGGTIVLCGPFSQISNYPVSTLRKHTGVITITSSHDGIDYRQTSGAEWTVPKGMRFQLGGPVRFADLSIRTTATSNNFLLVICNFNEFTMDQGVTASGFNYAAIGTALTIMGGCQDNLKNACGVDALGAEGVGSDVTMIVGNGYTKGHAEITLQELRESEALRKIFTELYA